MKPTIRDFWNSRRRFPIGLGMKMTRCLLVFSLLTYGCRDGLAALAFEQATPPADTLSGRQGGKSCLSNTATASLDGEQPQDRQSQAEDKGQAAAPQAINPFETLKLALEGNQLGASLTREGVTAAIKKYKAAYAIFKGQNFKLGMAATLFACGAGYYFLGQYREALDAFLEASKDSEGSGFDFLRPFLEASIGATYAGLGETDKARETLNRALPMVRQLNLAPLLALTLKGLGEVHVQIGQKHKALEYLNEARDLYRQTGNWQYEVQVLALISALDSSLGQSTEALETAHAAIDRAKEKNDPVWEAQGHLALGAAHASVGNLTSALAEYNLALSVFQAHDDKPLAATVLNNLGLIYIARGEYDIALDYFQKSLKLYQSIDEPKMAGYALQNIGTIYQHRGEALNALRYFEEALALARRHSDERLKAAILSSMADVYFLTDSREYVLNLLKENAATFREIEEPAHEAEALISLADAYSAMGRYQEALDVLRPALASRRLVDDPGREGYVLREMGFIYTNLGDRDNALKHYAAALMKLEATGDASGQADLYVAMGSIFAAEKDYQKAEELYRKGLALARTAGLRRSEVLILAGLGFVNEKRGDLAQAESFYEQQIAVGESLRRSARIEELKSGISSMYAGLFSPAIQLKLKLGKWAEAFELAERARARTFLDQMNNAHIKVGKGADPKLVEQEQALRFDIGALEEGLSKEQRNNPSSEAARAMAASLKEKAEAYTALLIRLKASQPDYAELQSYSPISLKEIQGLLGPQTTLVAYFVTADKTLAFVIGSDSFRAVEIAVKEADLRAVINWFRDFASLRDTQPQSLTQLHTWLVAPILPYIKTSDVAIVPHGILHYVPFAALTDGRRGFGDEHTIYYLPSAATLPALRRRIRPAGNRLLATAQSWADGLPALRFADEEAESVARLYRTQPLSTGRATRAEFLKRAPAYNLIHLATHAELNDHNPLFSRIRLSPHQGDNGAIEVREIYGMDLARTNLVVLSACQTQLGAQSQGDDIVGLNRAFIYAGAASVIASLWTVDDQATSFLMKAFYGHLRRGMSKAAALQAAQAATRKKYPHPYYWAAFVLTGDPGNPGRRQSHRHGRAGRRR